MNRYQAHYHLLNEPCETCLAELYDSPPRSAAEWALLIACGVVLALVLWLLLGAALAALTPA